MSEINLIEKNVTNLHYSKKLKESGIKQKSLFYWIFDKKNDKWDVWITNQNIEDFSIFEICSAFMSSELGLMIGDSCNEWAQGYNDCGGFYHFRKGCRGSSSFIKGCGASFSSYEASDFDEDEDRSSEEANARAEFIIHLIKNNGLNKKYLEKI